MKFIAGTEHDLYLGVKDSIEKQYEHCMYCVYDKPYVVVGVENTPNYEYINNHHIDIFNIPTLGGTIVVNKNDIGFGLVTPIQGKGMYFMTKAREYLIYVIKSHGYDVSIDENDILINGNKVASSCFLELYNGKIFFTVFQLSVNVNLELIQNICTKPMVKIPKGLSEFGITTEELLTNVVLKLEQHMSECEADDMWQQDPSLSKNGHRVIEEEDESYENLED